MTTVKKLTLDALVSEWIAGSTRHTRTVLRLGQLTTQWIRSQIPREGVTPSKRRSMRAQLTKECTTRLKQAGVSGIGATPRKAMLAAAVAEYYGWEQAGDLSLGAILEFGSTLVRHDMDWQPNESATPAAAVWQEAVQHRWGRARVREALHGQAQPTTPKRTPVEKVIQQLEQLSSTDIMRIYRAAEALLRSANSEAA